MGGQGGGERKRRGIERKEERVRGFVNERALRLAGSMVKAFGQRKERNTTQLLTNPNGCQGATVRVVCLCLCGSVWVCVSQAG